MYPLPTHDATLLHNGEPVQYELPAERDGVNIVPRFVPSNGGVPYQTLRPMSVELHLQPQQQAFRLAWQDDGVSWLERARIWQTMIHGYRAPDTAMLSVAWSAGAVRRIDMNAFIRIALEPAAEMDVSQDASVVSGYFRGRIVLIYLTIFWLQRWALLKRRFLVRDTDSVSALPQQLLCLFPYHDFANISQDVRNMIDKQILQSHASGNSRIELLADDKTGATVFMYAKSYHMLLHIRRNADILNISKRGQVLLDYLLQSRSEAEESPLRTWFFKRMVANFDLQITCMNFVRFDIRDLHTRANQVLRDLTSSQVMLDPGFLVRSQMKSYNVNRGCFRHSVYRVCDRSSKAYDAQKAALMPVFFAHNFFRCEVPVFPINVQHTPFNAARVYLLISRFSPQGLTEKLHARMKRSGTEVDYASSLASPNECTYLSPQAARCSYYFARSGAVGSSSLVVVAAEHRRKNHVVAWLPWCSPRYSRAVYKPPSSLSVIPEHYGFDVEDNVDHGMWRTRVPFKVKLEPVEENVKPATTTTRTRKRSAPSDLEEVAVTSTSRVYELYEQYAHRLGANIRETQTPQEIDLLVRDLKRYRAENTRLAERLNKAVLGQLLNHNTDTVAKVC